MFQVIKNHLAETIITTDFLTPGLLYYMDTKGQEVEIIRDEGNIQVEIS